MSDARPDPSVLINPPAELLGTRNAIIAWHSGKHVDNVIGALSIKWMPVGWGVWHTARARYGIEGDRFLVLNHGCVYSLDREDGEPQESFCPFFAAGFVEQAHGTLTTSDGALLDYGSDLSASPLEFAQQLYDNRAVLAQLRRMRGAVHDTAATADALEAQFHDLAERLLRSRIDVQRAIDRLPARRGTTRAELHRRLQRGREYLHANVASTVRLVDVARAACLSPHHFHRLFRAAFGCPPHAYVMKLRLERAARLLTRTDAPVTEICLAVGFESVSSFTTLFRRRIGLTPTAFRRDAAPRASSGDEFRTKLGGRRSGAPWPRTARPRA